MALKAESSQLSASHLCRKRSSWPFQNAHDILAESERGMRPRTIRERPQTKTRAEFILRKQHSRRKTKENTDKAATAVNGTSGKGRGSDAVDICARLVTSFRMQF